jgi:hypothetical protein
MVDTSIIGLMDPVRILYAVESLPVGSLIPKQRIRLPNAHKEAYLPIQISHHEYGVDSRFHTCFCKYQRGTKASGFVAYMIHMSVHHDKGLVWFITE